MITSRPILSVLLGLSLTTLVAFSAEPRQDPVEPRHRRQRGSEKEGISRRNWSTR